jgi:4-hydroxybenzoate polyprenyltransferase
MHIYLTFVRPFTLLPPALGMLSGSFVALGASLDGRTLGAIELGLLAVKIAAGGILAALLNGASNGLNQIFDIEIDRINKPGRPLPSSQLSLREAWLITVACYLAALLMAFAIGRDCFYLVAITALLTIVYSAPPLRSKRHWLLAAFTIAIPRGIFLKVAGWAVVRPCDAWEPWFIGGIFGLFLLGATTTKDYADMKGDCTGQCSTLPLRFGIVTSIWLIAPFLTLPFLLFPLGVVWRILTGNPCMLCVLGMTLTLWGGYMVKLLLRAPHSLTATENHPAWCHMYFMMMYAQIALAAAYWVGR